MTPSFSAMLLLTYANAFMIPSPLFASGYLSLCLPKSLDWVTLRWKGFSITVLCTVPETYGNAVPKKVGYCIGLVVYVGDMVLMRIVDELVKLPRNNRVKVVRVDYGSIMS